MSQQSMHQAYRNRYPWKMADRECVMCHTEFVVWVKERKMTCCELCKYYLKYVTNRAWLCTPRGKKWRAMYQHTPIQLQKRRARYRRLYSNPEWREEYLRKQRARVRRRVANAKS